MTLYEIVNEFKEIALSKPNINYVDDGDVFELNAKPNLKYGVFYVTQSNHIIGQDTTQFQLTLYYIDRVFEDYSNSLEVHSTGLQVLTDIINSFNYNNPDVNIEFDINATTFIHKFSDVCAGVFAGITITVDNEIGIC
jgi:hypothetical protein